MQILSNIYKKIHNYGEFLQGIPAVTTSQLSIDYIKEIIARPDPVILDIGCNNGDSTLKFLTAYENASIYCFEPDPRAIKRFKINLKGYHQVKLYEIAISSRNGFITFHQSGGQSEKHKPVEGWDLSGSIRKPKEHLKVYPWCTFENQIEVPTMTLDHWLEQEQIKLIDFIWMDVQGAEMDVYEGAHEALSKTRFLYTEYDDKEMYVGQKNLSTIKKHLTQFRILKRFPQDVLFAHRTLGHKKT